MNKKGIVIFAHNSQYLDYARLATISAKLATKNLNLPATLITDNHTIKWTKTNGSYQFLETVFEKIIISDQPDMRNTRNLKDGEVSQRIPFVNGNRNLIWELTPYERTLVLDSDFLVMTDNLNKYMDLECDFLISEAASDSYHLDRLGYHDKYISDTGTKLHWATTFIFTKNKDTEIFFNMCKVVADNYQYFADLYRFDPRQYRNDIAFSIVHHMLNGFSTADVNFLPPIKTFLDTDLLINVIDNKLVFLIKNANSNSYTASTVFNQDIHVMNKQNLLRFEENLITL